MNRQTFDRIAKVINSRHTTKAHAMNGETIPDRQIQKLLELADRAPNHGQTEPWRYLVFGGEALSDFGQNHSDIYWANTDRAKRRKSKYDKYIRYADNASHVIVSVMRPGTNPNIPEKEERAAVAAANQNILLGATALGIASYWSTGGMTYHPQFKNYLELDEEDRIIGVIYLGYSDESRSGKKRRIPLEEKVIWKKDSVAV